MRLFDYVAKELGISDEVAQKTPVIVADNIAHQIDQLDDSDSDQSPPAEAYGTVAPPFGSFFVEAKTSITGPDNTRLFIERGLWFEDITGQSLPENIAQSIAPPQAAKWRMKLTGFMRLNGQFIVYSGMAFLHLDEHGYILDDLDNVHIGQRVLPGADSSATFVTFIPFALKAISAMHKRCNVDLVTPTRQQRRQAARKHGMPRLADHYVLKVKPTVPQSFTGVGQPASSKKRREHVVRGHFRYYRPEAPLFGRYAGMVWVDEHTRGKDTIGTIKKDYEVDE